METGFKLKSSNMDERMARKMGELKAFCMLGQELFQKGETALETAFGKEKVGEVISLLAKHQQEIETYMHATEFFDAMNEKAEKTRNKVGGMAETYIGDAWDDPTELCEWLGFFEGAAIVHFSLVYGKAEKAHVSEVMELAKSGMELHQNLLSDVTKTIQTLH
jgi:hypothetical protein